MKNSTLKILPGILFMLLAFWACDENSLDLFEDYSDVLPEIETSSVSMPVNDTIVMMGELLSRGKGDLDFAGFCYHSDCIPEMNDNQIVFYPLEDRFAVGVVGLIPEDTVYVRTFAANSYGFTYGNTLEFVVPYPNAVEPPCSLGENTVFTDYLYSVNYPYVSDNGLTYDVTLYTDGGPSMKFTFYDYPVTGIYRTTKDDYLDESQKEVKVYIYDRLVKSGENVYINVNREESTFTIEFCDLVYTAYSGESTVSGNVLVN